MDVDEGKEDVQSGDLYLICSDGLTDMVDDSRIEKELLGHRDDLHACAVRLAQLANKGGGEDNISIVLIKIRSDFKVEENWQTQFLDLFKT